MVNSTTLDRIVELSLAEQRLLNQTEWSDADHARCADIQASLAQLWTERRAELVFDHAGPPRIVSAPDPRSQRQIARGMPPLPRGGD
jgi:hypothetical protein